MKTLWELFLESVPWIVFGLWIFYLLRENTRLREQMIALSQIVSDCADLGNSLLTAARAQEQRLSNVERAVVDDAIRENQPLPEIPVQRVRDTDFTFEIRQETAFGEYPGLWGTMTEEQRNIIVTRLREGSRPVPAPPEPTAVEKGGVPRPSLTGRRNIKL